VNARNCEVVGIREKKTMKMEWKEKSMRAP